MYQITCDDYVLHDLRHNDLKVIGAKCMLQLNKTGSLTFKITSTHPYYDKIKKHVSQITLYQDDTVLFSGRVLNDEIDFYNIKNIVCEGDLSYLLDSIQRYKVYQLDGGSANVIETYLTDILSIHNSQVDERKRFGVGLVTVADANNYLYKISNYNDTLSVIADDLLKTYGGYIGVRYTSEGKVIDYLASLNHSSYQTIEFGRNIVDMTKYIKGENIYTALIPLGKKLSDDINDYSRLDISSLENSTDGTIVKKSDYIYDSKAVEKYGWIWKTEIFDDVTTASNLLSKAKESLRNSINEEFTLELTAVDLHTLNVEIDKISLGDKVQCVSIPHNLDYVMVVEKMTIDIDRPENTKISLVLPNAHITTDNSLTSSKKETDKTINNVEQIMKDDIPTYNDITDIKNWVSDNFIPSTIDGKNVDLSDYARIIDVNNAFDELARALEGV